MTRGGGALSEEAVRPRQEYWEIVSYNALLIKAHTKSPRWICNNISPKIWGADPPRCPQGGLGGAAKPSPTMFHIVRYVGLEGGLP